MAKYQNGMIKWVYGENYHGPRNLLDPRIAIAQHLNWHKSTIAYTEFTLPEPDNYNRAIYTEQPMDFSWIENQVIYKNPHGPGWFSVFYIPSDQLQEYDHYMTLMDYTRWLHYRPSGFKIYKPMLMRGATKADMGPNERLLTMGYYKKFIVKYLDGDTTIVKSRLGEARANLADFVKDDEV